MIGRISYLQSRPDGSAVLPAAFAGNWTSVHMSVLTEGGLRVCWPKTVDAGLVRSFAAPHRLLSSRVFDLTPWNASGNCNRGRSLGWSNVAGCSVAHRMVFAAVGEVLVEGLSYEVVVRGVSVSRTCWLSSPTLAQPPARCSEANIVHGLYRDRSSPWRRLSPV